MAVMYLGLVILIVDLFDSIFHDSEIDLNRLQVLFSRNLGVIHSLLP